MAQAGTGLLEALQELYGDLVAVSQRPKEERIELPQIVGASLDQLGPAIKGLLDKPGRSKSSRDAVIAGKIKLSDDEYEITKEFQEMALQVADEIELDELEASRLILESEVDERMLGRPRRECALIRFHQQRKYLLSCVRVLLELTRIDELPGEVEDWLGSYVTDLILGGGPSQSDQKLVKRAIKSMEDIRTWLQRILDLQNSASLLGYAEQPEFKETMDYSQISLVEQHELLAVILCYGIDRRVATREDFTSFLASLKQVSVYDYAAVHMFPAIGSFITIFGSTEGNGDLDMARELNEVVCRSSDDESRSVPSLHAAVRAWWIAEYSGWYMEDAAGSVRPGIDIDAEDAQRSKQFTEALKDGAFDMLLAVSADVKSQDWPDPARTGMRLWLQRKTPTLPSGIPFSDFFQTCLHGQLEVFIDAFISNLPDILRKLRSEEDEQRQMKQIDEQDLDLERFLLIIAYSYEGRPESADAFWADPESNLAGFLYWASRRASTPLVSAFCEMLQAISEDQDSATSAHEFLLDEGTSASGKMRRTLSLTWSQILRELDFFTNKIQQIQVAPQTQSHKTGKLSSIQAEDEVESSMMLECYLRLITKLAINSDAARTFLLHHAPFDLDGRILELISCQIPTRLRACGFSALSALLTRKTLQQGARMWLELEEFVSGRISPNPKTDHRASSAMNATSPSQFMQRLFEQMSPAFEESTAFVQLLTTLTSLPEGYAPLNDLLPFPEDLGAMSRVRPGMEPYIDFALGHIFAWKSLDAQDMFQQRNLRYACLEFALTCLSTFNEDLIIFGNDTSIAVDSAIHARDLATYVTLHPFSRVMGWMYDSHFVKALLGSIHQDTQAIGKAAPDSPLMLSILRSIEVISKALDLQATYLDLVRPLIKPQEKSQSRSVFIPSSNAAFGSIEDGLMTSMSLIADLGSFCGLGQPDLTHASLKLLEKISTSSRFISAWQTGPDRQARRNKAIVALEEEGDAETITGALLSEMSASLDPYRRMDSPGYQTKIYLLDFLYSCICANPDRPTIAHLLLGFQCGIESISIEPGSAMDLGQSVFDSLLGIIVELPIREEDNMGSWLIDVKYKAMRVMRVLWSSRLSASIVLEQLRANDALFHLLLQGLVIQPPATWDGMDPIGPEFLVHPAAQGYIQYLSMRAMVLEYMSYELCSVAQNQAPALKRRVFEALAGQITVDGATPIPVPAIFEFHDFLPLENQFVAAPPQLDKLRDIDLRCSLAKDDDGNDIYDLDKVQQILDLKRSEGRNSGQIVAPQEMTALDIEEDQVRVYVAYLNRLRQVNAASYRSLRAWTKLLMVMTESNDFRGTNRTSFIIQVLQAVLPGLETYASENLEAATQFAKLARVLLFNLDFKSMASSDKESRAIGSLVSDKLLQLFQICLDAIAKWFGSPELRGIYYAICYRYITALVDYDQGMLSGRQNVAKAVQLFGERLINVVCDDAYGGDPSCQTAAMIFLGTLVNLGRHEGSLHVVEILNRLNFIGILVDSLRNVMDEWLEISRSGNLDPQQHHNARLALLLQLCQTREGAKDVLQANLFRSIEESGLFSADPELQVDSAKPKVLANHYALLVKVARIIGAAIVSRGAHNTTQGHRFLTEHRMLVMHVLKRSAGIGAGSGATDPELDEMVQELAEAFMVIISATGFLEYETRQYELQQKSTPALFH